MRKIVHIDMDAFYASVEQRDDPSLRGRPVVVAWRGRRSVVCAASYEARTYGVRSAMAAMTAERLCPDAVFVPPDFVRYREVTRQLHVIFARHTALIEPLSLDEAYLDVSTDLSGLATATESARVIRAAIREETGLTASAGIAPNKFLAKIASDWRKPDGQFVIRPHQIDAFLAPLAVGKLPGVGKVTQTRLEALGVRTVGDLRGVDTRLLQQQFGSYGQRLHELSHGIDERRVVPERATQSISAEDTFATDLPLAELEDAIRQLAAKTWRAAQKEQQRIGRTVVLKLKTHDFRILTRSLTPPQPVTDGEELARIALDLRQRVHLPDSARYRLVGVGLANFVERGSVGVDADLFGQVNSVSEPR